MLSNNRAAAKAEPNESPEHQQPTSSEEMSRRTNSTPMTRLAVNNLKRKKNHHNIEDDDDYDSNNNNNNKNNEIHLSEYNINIDIDDSSDSHSAQSSQQHETADGIQTRSALKSKIRFEQKQQQQQQTSDTPLGVKSLKSSAKSTPAMSTRSSGKAALASSLMHILNEQLEKQLKKTVSSKTETIATTRPCTSASLLRDEPAVAAATDSLDEAACALWLDTFNSWSSKQQLSALENLLERCCPHAHLKHVHNYIEPKLQRDYISELPRELSLLMLTYARPRDLFKLAQVSRYWYQMANDSILWKKICKTARTSVDDYEQQQRPQPSIDSKLFMIKTACFNSTSSSSSLSPYNYLFTAFNPYKRAYYIDYNVTKNWSTRPIPPQTHLRAHDDHVITCLKFDGRRILSGSDDSTLKVCELLVLGKFNVTPRPNW